MDIVEFWELLLQIIDILKFIVEFLLFTPRSWRIWFYGM